MNKLPTGKEGDIRVETESGFEWRTPKMTTPQFTPQKSYRDLVKGELLRPFDLDREEGKLVDDPAQTVKDNFEFQRPIHRQPDGSWRDEGEERKWADVQSLAQILSEHDTEKHLVMDYVKAAKAVCRFLGIPLEPEQEEWEKAFSDKFKDEYFHDALEKQRSKNAWREGWQAHERKQGEKK